MPPDPRVALDEAVYGLFRRTPDASARRLLSPMQRRAAAALLSGLALAFTLSPQGALIVLSALATGYFILVILCRVYLAWLGARQPYAAPVAPPATLGHEPVVTILLPLYREPECLPTLLQSIRAIDYPTDRLDVKLILEEDDPETRAEALRLGLPDHFDLIIVPDAAPRTKPKACNFALAYARGDFVVIYDAEDIPDPDQVRKAIAAFACGPDKLVCMQARLNYYNAEENWLTSGIMAQMPREINRLAA